MFSSLWAIYVLVALSCLRRGTWLTPRKLLSVCKSTGDAVLPVALATATALIMRRLALKSLSDPLDIACRAAVLTAMGGIVLAGGTLHYWQNMLSFVMFMFGSGIWLLSRPDAPSEDDDAPPDQEAGSEASVKKRFVPCGREA